MAGDRKRNAQTKVAHREQIAALRLKSWTVPMIAREVGVSEATVTRTLRELAEEWKQAALEDIAELKARELAKLDRIEAEATSAWERSRQDYTRKVAADRPKGSQGGGGRSASIETGSQNGDPRFLRIILDCQERRAKILGSDAPTKVAPTTPDGTQPYKPMTDAELDARIRELASKLGAEAAVPHGAG